MSWHVPGYVHRRELGNGTTGRVVLAVEEETGDLVVIKYLKVNFEDLDRVREDVALISTLDSRYLVHIRGYVEDLDAGRAAIVMDPINGVSLRLLLRDHGALAPEAALLLFRDSLLGLGAAHDIDVAHGDYRPENLLVDAEGECVILDVSAVTWTDHDVTLSTGVYRSPERWHRDSITASADVYAASITFVEMYVGEPPYWEASQLLALRYMHEQDEIPVEAFPVALRDVVRLGLAKDAEMRADVTTLLELIALVAVDEFGVDWELRGRRLVRERVALLALPFSGGLVDQEEILESNVELVELDDYYVDEALIAGVIGVETVADEVVVVDEVDVVEVDVVEADMVEVVEVDETALIEADELVVLEVDEVIDEELLLDEVIVTEEAVVEEALVEEIVVDEIVVEAAVVEAAVVEEAVVEEIVVEEAVVDEIVVVDETGLDEGVDEGAEVVIIAGAVGAASAAEEIEISDDEAAGVIAAAEEIVVLARIEEVAAATALANAAVEEELTEEEEFAVAEVEQILLSQEAAAAAEAAAAEEAPEAAAAQEAAEVAAAEAAAAAVAEEAAQAAAAEEAAQAAAIAEALIIEEAAEAMMIEAAAEAAAALEVAEAAAVAAAAEAEAAAEAAEAAAAEEAAEAAAAEAAAAETVIFGRIPAAEAGEKTELVAASAGIPGEEIPTAQIPRIRDSGERTPVLVGAGGGGGRRRGGGGGIVAGGGGNETTSFVRRHPWATGLIGIIFILLCGGAALAITGGPAGGPATPVAIGSSTHQTGLTTVATQTIPAGQTVPAGSPTGPAGSPTIPAGGQTTPAGGQSIPAGGQSIPAGGQTTPATGQTTPAASSPPATTPATTPPSSGTPQPAPPPTLPVTGIHPIRQMLAVALTLLACGTWLMFVFRRRRDEASD
jgi:hypothetical protein